MDIKIIAAALLWMLASCSSGWKMAGAPSDKELTELHDAQFPRNGAEFLQISKVKPTSFAAKLFVVGFVLFVGVLFAAMIVGHSIARCPKQICYFCHKRSTPDLVRRIEQSMETAARGYCEAEEAKQRFGTASSQYHEARAAQQQAESEIRDVIDGDGREHFKRYGEYTGNLVRQPRTLAQRLCCTSRYRHRECVFVSGPKHDFSGAPALAVAVAVMHVRSMSILPGAGQDQFHMEIMSEAEMQVAKNGCRTEWKERICAGIDLAASPDRTHEVAIVMIDGGLGCQWEVSELEERILPAQRQKFDKNIELMRFSDWRAFIRFFLNLPEMPDPRWSGD